MPCPGVGPCKPWDLDLSCCLTVSGAFPDPCILDGDPVPQEVIDSAILAASQYMWAKTGRQFGCCQVTIRPTQNPIECCGDEIMASYGFPWIPMHLADGSWTNVKCACKADPCTCCSTPCEIQLPYPVCSIDEVKIDGKIIGKSLYRVDDFRKLVFTPGTHSVNQAITALVSGPITITGGTAQPYLGGVAFPDGVGQFYNINLGGPKCDLVFEFEVQPGASGEFVFALAGGQFEVLMGEGHATFPPTHNGPVVSYFPPGDANSRYSFFIIAQDTGCPEDIGITITAGSGALNVAPILTNVSWTEEGADRNCFPECNDLSKTDDEVGTMSVTLTYGRPIPEMVKKGAEILACELIAACVGKPCSLPKRVTSISRQGMSATFLDPMEFLSEGKTGIFLADLAIMTYNPHGLYKRAWVGSPDSINKWRVTTWENKPGGREDPFGPNCT